MDDALMDGITEIGDTVLAQKICIGTITDIDADGGVRVEYPGNTQGPVQAYYTHAFKTQIQALAEGALQKVLLVFNDDELEMPIIVDTLHSKIDRAPDPPAVALDTDSLEEVVVDGKRITFEAREEITLNCGKATIQLTKAGKILIRGAYLLTRASGVNRIRGGSVQIN